MRSFLVLLVLAGIGAGIWWFGFRGPAAAAASPPAELLPAPSSGPPLLVPAPAELPGEAKALKERADALWAAGGEHPPTSSQAPKIAQAYTAVLRALYGKPGQQAAIEQLIGERLKPLGDALFFSKARYPQDETGLFGSHSVQPGESPDVIARKYGMSFGLINRLRGAAPNSSSLQAGEVLKIVNVKEKGFAIRVEKSQYLLDVFIAGIFARRYSCSIGAAESPTPVGRTTIVKRELNPATWKDPRTGEIIPAGDPRFILGPVWLAFDNATFPRPGIGIHGYTGDDGGMGRKVSNGCVRMRNDEVVELFHTLSGPDRATTTVEVVD